MNNLKSPESPYNERLSSFSAFEWFSTSTLKMAKNRIFNLFNINGLGIQKIGFLNIKDFLKFIFKESLTMA